MTDLFPFQLSNKVIRELKKIRKTDKALYDKINRTIMQIRKEPYIGERKSGDLKGIFCLDIIHKGTNYEMAYKINIDENDNKILIIMIGSRENFYKALKRYIN